jgi:hypothetical protein
LTDSAFIYNDLLNSAIPNEESEKKPSSNGVFLEGDFGDTKKNTLPRATIFLRVPYLGWTSASSGAEDDDKPGKYDRWTPAEYRQYLHKLNKPVEDVALQETNMFVHQAWFLTVDLGKLSIGMRRPAIMHTDQTPYLLSGRSIFSLQRW